MRLKLLSSSREINDSALTARMDSAPSVSISHRFLVLDGKEEVAFLVLDIWPSREDLVMYEIFIRPDLRNRGFGTRVLATVEDYARSIGRSAVVVRPEPLDQTHSREELAAWYKRRGYAQTTDPQLIEKQL